MSCKVIRSSQLGSSRPRRRGMSLPEVLASITISALLLTGVATAFVTASKAVETNDQFYRATQAARISVNQIMTESRRCQSGVVSDTSLELTLHTGEQRTYSFDDASKTLKMTLESLPTPQTFTLARNVASATFATDGKTISMSITVQIGANSVLLNGSALPRRTVEYK